MNQAFQDEFSKQAAEYAKHRPRYPVALIDFVVSLAPGRALAWDCATGNGQVAVALAESFGSVHASDPSAAQLEHAQSHPRVRYALEPGEACSLSSASADLVTCAQALHWMKPAEFFAEVRRVLKPGGAFAAWTYWECRTPSDDINKAVDRFTLDDLGLYWAPQVAQRFKGNRGIEIPLAPVECPEFVMEADWDLSAFMGYLRSWSAVQHYIDRHGESPLGGLQKLIEPLWGDPKERKTVSWNLNLRAGRV